MPSAGARTRSTATVSAITVEVAYATPERQDLFSLEVPSGSTIADVLERCRAERLLPDAVLARPDVGVFGRPAALDRVLESGDRVEIYRPLEVDPKEARRRRAGFARRRGSG